MVKPFAGLESGFKQESYFKDVLGLLVSLVSNIYSTYPAISILMYALR